MPDEITIVARLEDLASKGLTALRTGITVLDKSVNDFSTGLTTRTASAFSNFKNNLSNLGVATEGLRTRLESLTHTLSRGLVSGMKMATIGMIGLVAATGSMAYETEKNYTQFKNVIMNFSGGNKQLTDQLYNQAKQYNDIVSISGQESGLKQLLVNPAFRSQAGAANAAILKISAASGNQANSVYSMLTNAIGRIEDRQRLDPRTLLMLQKAGVNINPFLKQFGFNPSPNSPLTMEAAQKYIQEIGTPQQMLNFLQTVAKQPGMAGAITRQRETPSGAVAYLKGQVENAIDSASGAFDKAISGAIGPVTKMIAGKGGLIQTLAPPLLNFVGKLAQGLSYLIPFIQGPLKSLANFFGGAIKAIIPAIQRMQPIGRQLGQAFYKFLAAFIPVMPALVNALVTFMQVLPAMTPPLVTLAQVFAKLLVTVLDIVNAGAKLVASTGAFKVIGEIVGAGVALLLVGKGISTLVHGAKAIWSLLTDIEKAGKGLWTFLKSPFGGGGKNPTLGTEANPMWTRSLGGCSDCGGGGSGPSLPCSQLCDDTPNLKVLSGGIDAGLTQSAAGTPLVMSQVLKYGGLTAAGIGLIAEVAGGTQSLLGKALNKYLGMGTSTTSAAATKTQAEIQAKATAEATQKTLSRLPFKGTSGIPGPNEVGHPTTLPTAPAGGYTLSPAAQAQLGKPKPPGHGMAVGTDIGEVGAAAGGLLIYPVLKYGPDAVKTLISKAKDFWDDIFGGGGKGGGSSSSSSSALHSVTRKTKVPPLGSQDAAMSRTTNLLKNLAVQQAIGYFGGAVAAAGATGADEVLGWLGLTGGGVAALAGAASAKGLPKKLRDEQFNPKMGDTYKAGSTAPTEYHIHIQNANFHDVQDVKSLKKALAQLAQDNTIRGARKPNDWASSGFGFTNVLRPGT